MSVNVWEAVTEQYPLSPLQHGMLFHHIHSGPHTGVDIEQLDARFHEPIRAEALSQAWSLVTARHAALRTRFRWENLEAPLQEVVTGVEEATEIRDLSSLAGPEQDATLASFLKSDRERGFDLAAAPLWRVTLFRLSDNEYRMVWTYSHAILDSSFSEVIRDVFDTYDTILRQGTPTFADRPSYRDHIEFLQGDLRARAREIAAFWRDHLAGFVTPTNLDAVRIPAARAEGLPGGHDTVRFRLSRPTSDRIRQICEKEKVRPSTFVDAAWALVLSAFSGEDDVVFGSTRAGRRSSIPDAQRIIGLFINTVPMRARLHAPTTGRTLLRELRQQQQALRAYEHTPLVEITAAASIPRGTPLFDTIIVFNDTENDARLKSFGPSWLSRDFELHDQTNFPMNVMAYDGPELSFKLSFAPRVFERATVERIASLFTLLLDALAERPDAALDALPRLPAADAMLLEQFNDTAAPIPPPLCVHEAFEAQVDRTPNAVAVVFRGQSLTYRQLDDRANGVAHELIALGVGPDTMVGIFAERSLEMVVGLLGILKAGGAYVPMDPAYPSERIAWMLEDTTAPVVLTLDRLRSALPKTNAAVRSLDGFAPEGSPTRPPARAAGHHLAYVIFTSGSTGRPKGVQIEHRNVANFFVGMDAVLGTAPGTWLALTSISFDISVLEIFWTLGRGFTVVIQEEAESATRAARPRASTRPIGFSLFYFAADAGEAGNKYRLLLEGAKFADTHDFEAVWTPERHFHAFGGLYPNPAVTSAAVAAVTTRVGIRAGSVVLPLHNPIRCAEEWSVVDNLSNGRVGLSFASGWHARDFALAPSNFKERREVMARGIETIKSLWRGEPLTVTGGDGKETQIRMFPPPVQREPRIWVTASGNPETFEMAGRTGAHILTNLLVMKPEELVANSAIYRKAFREAGHEGDGHITLMLHTFVGKTVDDVRDKVRAPFLEYLRTSTDLINKARWELTAFAKADDRTTAGGASMNLDDLSKEDMDAILDHAFERYFATAGLFGTPESCLATIDRLRDLGVDEIACLIDFGIDTDSVLANLPQLDELRRRSIVDAERGDESDDYAIAAQIRRHQVTHLQCTPSLLAALAMEDDTAAAIGSLRTLLVGGEALPTALVERLRPQFPAALHNMYGPTETTIWSTTAPIAPDTPITLGQPIANTSIHIVDRRQRMLPIGVPGELLIGGAGVVRGYLSRPELTAERFIPDQSSRPPRPDERLYRTGDLARWLPSGDVEFFGRLDHQIKIRGYRIELGEIESVIGEHASVRESVVVAREGAGGDPRLVAYVVPRKDGEAGGANIPSNWEAIWDQTYKDTHDKDAGFNTAGWNSSFTGLPYPEREIHEWAELSVARILSVARETAQAPRVLEVGCGTGMILFRVAPHVQHYVGVDFSASALAYIQSRLEANGLTNVRLERLAADDLAALTQPGGFDVVVLNSVVQYFPDADYLQRVLAACYAQLAPGGAIVVGDVRSQQHLETFYSAIELARAEASATVPDLRARVQRRASQETELVVDGRFFDVVARTLGAVVERVEVKPGRAHNEMTQYRYDVVLRKPKVQGQTPSLAPQSVVSAAATSLDAIRRLLADEPPSLRVTSIRNARLVNSAAALDIVQNGNPTTAGEIQKMADAAGPGVEPDDLRTLDPRYDAAVEFSAAGPDLIDVTFRHRTKQPVIVRVNDPNATQPASAYTNVPVTAAATGGTLVQSLRERVREKLPEYMVPSAFVLMEALPLTPNGKIDRRALPEPERTRTESARHEPPSNDLERGIVRVLQELIGGGEVSVDDNFFDLGANSLMMVQASVRLRSVLGRPVPLVRMFQYPTARALATSLGATAEGPSIDVKQGQERAQQRKDALQRMRRRH